jgi:hypothetical protein
MQCGERAVELAGGGDAQVTVSGGLCAPSVLAVWGGVGYLGTIGYRFIMYLAEALASILATTAG